MKPIEYLSPYLPYELKFLSSKNQFKYGEREILLCNGLSIDTTGELNIEFLKDDELYFSNSMNKVLPILRPLSDLTKEIEHNGEKFVPLIKLAELFFNKSLSGFDFTHYDNCRFDNGSYIVNCCVENDSNRYLYYGISANIEMNKYRVTQKLISWHFDVFNLHEKGLCIYYDEI